MLKLPKTHMHNRDVMNISILRKYIRSQIHEAKLADEANLKDDALNALLSLENEYGFVTEDLGNSEIAARFGSSSTRDMKMQSLIQDLMISIPDASAQTANITKHSREVLRLARGRQKLTVAFKAPSTGQTGLDFETVLFAVLKDSLGSTEMSGTETNRVSKVFGIEKTDPNFYSTLNSLIQNPPTDELKDLVNRADNAAVKIVGFFPGITNVKMKGGEGGKGDLELIFPKGASEEDSEKKIDLSLKHEKQEGTNIYEFNKDLGDGIKTLTMGRFEKVTRNFIPSGDDPWWRIARRRIIDAINDSQFKSALTAEEKQDFIMNSAAKSSMKVSSIAAEVGGAAERAPSQVLREASDKLIETLSKLEPNELSSIINESRLGSSGTNPVYKMTSSPSGTVFKRVSGVALDKGKENYFVRVSREKNKTGKEGTTITASIIDKKTNDVVASLVIRGLKFRSGIYSSSLSDLSIKTRA